MSCAAPPSPPARGFARMHRSGTMGMVCVSISRIQISEQRIFTNMNEPSAFMTVDAAQGGQRVAGDAGDAGLHLSSMYDKHICVCYTIGGSIAPRAGQET